MDDEEFAVSWRAAIVLADGTSSIPGHLRKIGKDRAVVKTGQNLPSGYRCSMAVRMPKSRADEPTQFVEGDGVVAVSVLVGAYFHITLQSLQIKNNDKAILNEHLRRHKETWKSS